MASVTNIKKDADTVLALGLQAVMEITLMVPSEARTMCGLTILVPNERGVPAKKCVFGGLIDIDGEWYGLVARHPFQDSTAFRQPSICVPAGSNNEVNQEPSSSSEHLQPYQLLFHTRITYQATNIVSSVFKISDVGYSQFGHCAVEWYQLGTMTPQLRMPILNADIQSHAHVCSSRVAQSPCVLHLAGLCGL